MGSRVSFENLQIYQMAEKLSDIIWSLVGKWDYFGKNTVGMQLVRSVDSIGANIAEGSGRGSYAEIVRFAKISRGSLYETIHWLRQAYKRNLITKDQANELKTIIDQLTPKLSAYINAIEKKKHNK